MLIDDLPLWDLPPEPLELLSLERRRPAPARHTCLARELAHLVPPVETNLSRKGLRRLLNGVGPLSRGGLHRTSSSLRRRSACTTPSRAGCTPWPLRDLRRLPPLLLCPPALCTRRRTVVFRPTGGRGIR